MKEGNSEVKNKSKTKHLVPGNSSSSSGSGSSSMSSSMSSSSLSLSQDKKDVKIKGKPPDGFGPVGTQPNHPLLGGGSGGPLLGGTGGPGLGGPGPSEGWMVDSKNNKKTNDSTPMDTG